MVEVSATRAAGRRTRLPAHSIRRPRSTATARRQRDRSCAVERGLRTMNALLRSAGPDLTERGREAYQPRPELVTTLAVAVVQALERGMALPCLIALGCC